jgi:hypothetical protein
MSLALVCVIAVNGLVYLTGAYGTGFGGFAVEGLAFQLPVVVGVLVGVFVSLGAKNAVAPIVGGLIGGWVASWIAAAVYAHYQPKIGFEVLFLLILLSAAAGAYVCARLLRSLGELSRRRAPLR